MKKKKNVANEAKVVSNYSIVKYEDESKLATVSDLNSKISNNLPILSSGSLEAYINFVNSIPLLTQDEEFALADDWQKNENVESARYLVLSHLRLVVSIARGYIGYGLPLADIIQEGTIGLMKAVKKFDCKRNVRLVTFAGHWIRAEINDYIIKNWRIVRTVTTINHRKLFFNLRSMRKDMGNLSEIEANEIAKNLDVSRDDVVEMNMRLTGGDVSLIPEEGSYGPIDYLADEVHTPEHIIAKKEEDKLHTEGIDQALAKLDERSRDIIQARWLKDPSQQLTLQELAQKYNVSAERIRQIEVQAMQKMKQYLSEFK
ncbi:MAG: RNA polymerase sigma factor RpoH [Burkholderiales bacterium]|nr:RNA polymerase sigma factor RpoH [Burkholderiales bacterium]